MAEAMAFDERDTRAIALPYINVMGLVLACADQTLLVLDFPGIEE